MWGAMPSAFWLRLQLDERTPEAEYHCTMISLLCNKSVSRHMTSHDAVLYDLTIYCIRYYILCYIGDVAGPCCDLALPGS